jgi:hypothetical protein
VIDAFISFDWSWDPGFRGLLTVVLATVILCGSVFLIMATNSGARLGFLLALTGFCAWMTVMAVIWTLYGIGWRGASPSWEVVDTVRTAPCTGVNDPPDDCDFTIQSDVDVAADLPLPALLPDPVALRDDSDVLLAAYPPTQRDPSLSDLVTVDVDLMDELNDQADPWRVLETSNRYTGETQAVVAEALGPNDEALFESSADYIVIGSYLTGGKAVREDDSILSRAAYKVTRTLEVSPPTFYAAVQLQQVIPQEAKPGQAPPAPVRDQDADVITVIMQRVDTGKQRLPQIGTLVVMGISTAVLCSMLHRRDQLAKAQREATAGAS